jgi:hypothetical protein
MNAREQYSETGRLKRSYAHSSTISGGSTQMGSERQLPEAKGVNSPTRLLLSVISNELEEKRYFLVPLPSCATAVVLGGWIIRVVY